MSNPKVEGYWYSKSSPEYPKPVAIETAWEGKEEFLQKLNRKEKSASRQQFKGISTCRICKCANGSVEYSNSKFIWPEGYRHYIESHNIKPSDDFFNYVMGKNIKV
jgi:hypothetical protein